LPGSLRRFFSITDRGDAQRREQVAKGVGLATAFGLTIDMIGPVFGNEALLAEIAGSAELATLVGERSRYLWPDSYDLRRIPIRNPTLIYPMSVIWRGDNPHPALNNFRDYLHSRRTGASDVEVWTPEWAAYAGHNGRQP